MSEKEGVNVKTIERDIAHLKKKGILTHVGDRKQGHWAVLPIIEPKVLHESANNLTDARSIGHLVLSSGC